MSKLKLFVLAGLAVALVAIALFGGGWKWSHHDNSGYAPERLAGWTWDAGVIASTGPGNGNANGHSNASAGPSTDPTATDPTATDPTTTDPSSEPSDPTP
jgi:hypothetical protein